MVKVKWLNGYIGEMKEANAEIYEAKGQIEILGVVGEGLQFEPDPVPKQKEELVKILSDIGVAPEKVLQKRPIEELQKIFDGLDTANKLHEEGKEEKPKTLTALIDLLHGREGNTKSKTELRKLGKDVLLALYEGSKKE